MCQEAVDRGGRETAEAARALPDVVTAALSAALQKADQQTMLPSVDQASGQPAFQVSSLADESQQQLRLLVAEELARAVQQINTAQVCCISLVPMPFLGFGASTLQSPCSCLPPLSLP